MFANLPYTLLATFIHTDVISFILSPLLSLWSAYCVLQFNYTDTNSTGPRPTVTESVSVTVYHTRTSDIAGQSTNVINTQTTNTAPIPNWNLDSVINGMGRQYERALNWNLTNGYYSASILTQYNSWQADILSRLEQRKQMIQQQLDFQSQLKDHEMLMNETLNNLAGYTIEQFNLTEFYLNMTYIMKATTNGTEQLDLIQLWSNQDLLRYYVPKPPNVPVFNFKVNGYPRDEPTYLTYDNTSHLVEHTRMYSKNMKRDLPEQPKKSLSLLKLCQRISIVLPLTVYPPVLIISLVYFYYKHKLQMKIMQTDLRILFEQIAEFDFSPKISQLSDFRESQLAQYEKLAHPIQYSLFKKLKKKTYKCLHWILRRDLKVLVVWMIIVWINNSIITKMVDISQSNYYEIDNHLSRRSVSSDSTGELMRLEDVIWQQLNNDWNDFMNNTLIPWEQDLQLRTNNMIAILNSSNITQVCNVTNLTYVGNRKEYTNLQSLAPDYSNTTKIFNRNIKKVKNVRPDHPSRKLMILQVTEYFTAGIGLMILIYILIGIYLAVFQP